MTLRDREYLERHLELAYIRLRDIGAKEQDEGRARKIWEASAACSAALAAIDLVGKGSSQTLDSFPQSR